MHTEVRSYVGKLCTQSADSTVSIFVISSGQHRVTSSLLIFRSTRHPLSNPLRPILFCLLDPSKHEKWMPPSLKWDELPVWRHFQNGLHGNWQNNVFASNSASRVNRNEISVSTPILYRMRNSIKSFTGFYDFYLTHDELPVKCHFQNGRHIHWRITFFTYNSASMADRYLFCIYSQIC